jgi:hypothetical protein
LGAEACRPSNGKARIFAGRFQPSDNEIQTFKTVDLGELLFNLQHIDGFDDCIERLKAGNVEPCLAELDVARMLYINDHIFWFNRPEGEGGYNFDFMLILSNDAVAAIEAKCNLEIGEVNINSIRNSLAKARKQLPKNVPGIIFVKVPASSASQPGFADQAVKVAQEFLAGTERVVSVKFYVAPFEYKDGFIGQTHAFFEISNPNNKFDKSANWDLLRNWLPKQQQWNMMPPKWVRLLYFPLRELPH